MTKKKKNTSTGVSTFSANLNVWGVNHYFNMVKHIKWSMELRLLLYTWQLKATTNQLHFFNNQTMVGGGGGWGVDLHE